MAKYIDISNWKTQVHVHTGGTRDKFIAISPDDDKKYYFKTSINKGFKNYKYEFWSEVIASELGRSLGFNVLIYDVASFKDKIGCLSKSIIEEDKKSTMTDTGTLYKSILISVKISRRHILTNE